MAITVSWNTGSTELATQLLQPLIVKATSTLSATTLTAYAVEVTVNDVLTFKANYPANPSGVALIDISRVLQSTMSSEEGVHNLPLADDDIFKTSNGDAIKFVSVKVTEVLSTGSPTNATITRAVLNSPNDFTDVDGIIIKDRVCDTAGRRYLTDMPLLQEISTDEEMYLSYLHGSVAYSGGLGAGTNLRIRYYNGETLLKTQNITISDNGGSTRVSPTNLANTKNLLQFVACGPANLNEMADTDFHIPSNCTHYDVTHRLSGADVSAVYRFDIVCNEEPKAIRCKFRNRYGVWDFFSFRGNLQKSKKIERRSFEQFVGNYQGSNYQQQNYNRGRASKVLTEYNEIEVNTDYITEEESEWLAQLMESDDVRLLIGGKEYPVIIDATDYNINSYKYNQLFQFSVTFKFSNQRSKI